MKKIILFMFCMFITFGCIAQNCDLPISIAFSQENESISIPESAKNILVDKLHQVLTANGISGNMDFDQFALVFDCHIVDKHVVSGPPINIVYNLSFTFKVVDTYEKTVFSTYSIDVDATGENETKAFISGVKQIKTKNQNIENFIDQARLKIIAYYDKNYNRIIQKAKVLSDMNKYDEALCHVMSVPECCEKYSVAMKIALPIYRKYIEREGNILLRKAEAVWASKNNDEGASEAASLLIQIDPDASCYGKAKLLLNEIKNKSSKSEPWNFIMKQYDDSVSLENQRISAARAVGVAYGQGQRNQTTNLMFLK